MEIRKLLNLHCEKLERGGSENSSIKPESPSELQSQSGSLIQIIFLEFKTIRESLDPIDL